MNRRRSRITHIDRVGLVICGIYVERMVSSFFFVLFLLRYNRRWGKFVGKSRAERYIRIYVVMSGEYDILHKGANNVVQLTIF
ncbi:hypothetical protein HDV62DRAFT_366166 [Trichoderma sp. SZMC 28011]